MDEKLYKQFPTIAKGLKKIINTSYSLHQSLGEVDIPFDNDDTEENDYFNHIVISQFLNNAIEDAEHESILTCTFKTTKGGFVFFQYTTSGNLGFSFRKFRNNKTLFLIWKVNPSESRSLTRDFAKIGWHKDWRWALTTWWFEAWKKMREPRVYYVHPLKAWWFKLLRKKPKLDFDKDVPF